jgi:PAS domain S-box-containing protein
MKLTFRNKIYVGLVSLLIIFGGGVYFAASRIISEALLEENRNRGLLIAGNLAARATEPILAMDFLRLKDLVDEAVALNKDVHYAFIVSAQGEVLVHTFAKGFPVELKAANSVPDSEKYNRRLLDTGNELIYDFAAPVLIDRDRFGTVRLGLLRTRVQQAIDSLSLMMFMATALIVVFSGLIGALLARTVGKRIETLHRSIERVMRGDLEVQTAPPLKKNCWDIMECTKGKCPAYNESHIRCWYMAGTLCPSCVEGEYAKKIESCLKCPVYKACSGDEIQNVAESFDYMVRILKNRLLDLKAIETTLTEQQYLLTTILNATPDFVSLQDRDSIYRAVNKAFCDIVGRSEDDIIGRADFDLFPETRAKANREEDLKVIKSGEALTKENRIQGPGGERWIHLVKLPVRDGAGAIVGLLCSGRDITDFKEFQERLTQAQKMEAVGQLTAGIAHEINTPLGVILGYSQLLLEDVEPDSQMHADLKTIEKHTKICRKIVSDLLRFSRHAESRMALLDINKAIIEALTVVEHTFSLERVRVERRLDSGIPEVVGDEEKLKQAVVNLLNNAFDAIGTDGLIVVTSAFNEETGEVTIAVADTGSGIPPEDRDRIFDPFFTTKGVGRGTGLGLSVTFGIVKDHGGRIEVQSPLPQARAREMIEYGIDESSLRGAVFTIYLPAGGPEAATERVLSNGDDSRIG